MVASLRPFLVVVEDDWLAVKILQRALSTRKLDYALEAVTGGREALDFLRSETMTDSLLETVIVLLDLNMPGMDGHEFLDELRADSRLRKTIVFVVTSSDFPQDISKAYDRNVAGYFTKANLAGLLDTVQHYAANVEFPPVNE